MRQAGASEEERAFLRELDGIKGRHRATGRTEQHQVSAGTQQVEILVEGSFPDTVVDDIYTLAAGQLLGFSLKILPGISDDVVGARIACQLGFVVGTGGADYARSDR